MNSKTDSHRKWGLMYSTYREITDIAANSGSILIVPVGSVEQHGYHLPVGTDSLLVEAVTYGGIEKVDQDLPILVTPVIWTGYSPHHQSFGGTVTLDATQLIDLLDAVVESFLNDPFDNILLINGHGGNISHVNTAISVIGDKHSEIDAMSLTYFLLATPFLDDLRDSGTGGMAHGGEFETSLMLHLFPDLVDEEQIEATMLDESYTFGIDDLVEGGEAKIHRNFDFYSDSGAVGDPSVSSAEKGAVLFERLTERMADLLLEVHTTTD